MDAFDIAYQAWKINNADSLIRSNKKNTKIAETKIDELITLMSNTAMNLAEACENIGLNHVHMNTIRYRLKQRDFDWRNR